MAGPWTRREFLIRSAAAGGLAIGGSAILGACTDDDGGNALEDARDDGSIRIGIAGEAPYGFTDEGGRVTGEAPEVAKVVLTALGIGSVQAEQVEFGSLIPALNARRYEMVCAGMNITPPRCEQAAFSIPDYSAKTAFLVPGGNPERISTFEDVAAKNLKIAVLGAAVEKGYAEGAGVSGDNIQVFPDQNALLQAVTGGRVYCASLTDISLKWLVRQNPNAGIEVTDGFDPVVDGAPVVSAGGFVFRTGDDELREAFDTELHKIHDNGRWVEIARPFGFTEDNLPAEGLTTEQLCSAA